MNMGFLFAPAAAFALIAGAANALTLTNREPEEQHLRIAVDELADPDEFGASGFQNVAIGAGQTMRFLCDGGCTIVLESGDDERFEGHEVVVLEKGRLTIAE